MKYDEKKFDSSVKEYKKILGNVKAKSFLVVFDIKNKKAFFSIAPLSRAIHELNADMHVIGMDKKSKTLDVLYDVWKVFKQNKAGKFDEKTEALMGFVEEIEKRAKGKFVGLFERPDYTLEAKGFGFEGDYTLPFKDNWFREYKSKELDETCEKIWRDVYNLKKNERVSIGFVLIQKDEMLGHPLEDYLDSYAIAWHMMLKCKDKTGVSMVASTQRRSMLEKSEGISDLKAVLIGCELCKEVEEDVFKKYKKVSKLLNLKRISVIDASFFISGKGYPGKHNFGEVIGYPSPNKKTRWQSPGQIIYKLDFYPQTALDDRNPLARVGFTETLPIDIFIETCNIDWKKMRDRNWKIKEIADKCKVIKVFGEKIDGFKTDFEVGLVKKDGIRRWVRTSDTDVREKINSEYLKMTGIKAGTMANLPGGETFVTPEYVKGTIAGDVVISIDQSYLLSDKDPLIIQSDGKEYKLTGPKKIIDKVNEKKKEAWEMIMNQEKYKSLPQEIIDLKKKNFNMINEFAINTNPNAKLCDYLIVNEKIARMMHIALGSGFEPDRATEYHTDIVINSPRQKMNIYGVDEKGKKHWIIKKGEFVV
ncbi:MAG: hypothetical protein QF568_05610 [Flavobacteriales bacterium]|jgi:hypothetical protein|nr:hypothetical protein [Flavobacteriales bacterium]|tara:strand:+ start:3123 stop:4892 length:1770 start_codon:yes stop_codon:yes gene_type:complete